MFVQPAASLATQLSNSRPKMVVLRALFRRSVIGDCKSEQYTSFWTAVARFAPTARYNPDITAPLSARTIQELLPAYDLVAELLREHPRAWQTFLSNGQTLNCVPVVELRDAVDAYLRATAALAGITAPVRQRWDAVRGQRAAKCVVHTPRWWGVCRS